MPSSVAYAWDHFRLKNVANLMLQLYALWAFRHVTFQKPDFANYPKVVAFQKNIVLAINLFGCFLNCKNLTGHEIIDFSVKKIITHSQCARAKRGLRIDVLVSCHGSMISINFNRKVTFYMYKQYSNTFGLVKYIHVGNIQKRKVLSFFCGSVY